MKWIKVEDSLPEEYTDVLFYDGSVIGFGYYIDRFAGFFWFRSKKRTEAKNVTHWCHLPEPPTSI